MARFLHPKEHGSWRERVTIEEKVWSGPAPYAARVGTPHRPSSALTAENLGYHTVNYSEAMKANALELQRLNSSVGKPPRPAAAVASVARALGRDLLPEDLLKPPPVAPYASTASGSPERFRATSAQRFPLPRQLMSKFRSKSGQPVNDPLSELGPLAPPTSNGTYGRHVGVTMSTLNVQQQLAVQAQLHEELTGSGASIGKLSQRPVVTPDDRRTRSPEEKERLENAVHSLADKVDQIEAAIRAERAQRTVLRQRVNHLAALASTVTGEPNLTQQRNGRPNTKVKPAKSVECPQIAKPFSPNADPASPPRLTASQLREGTEGIRKQGRGVFPHFAVPL